MLYIGDWDMWHRLTRNRIDFLGVCVKYMSWGFGLRESVVLSKGLMDQT
jgi:hypothetical protein